MIGMINDYTGKRDIDIGEIDIKKNFSFFEVDKAFTDEIIKGFKKKAFKKRDINVEVAEGPQKESRPDSNRGRKRESYKKTASKPGIKRKRRKP